MEPPLQQIIGIAGVLVLCSASALRRALWEMELSIVPWYSTLEAREKGLNDHWFSREAGHSSLRLKKSLYAHSLVGWSVALTFLVFSVQGPSWLSTTGEVAMIAGGLVLLDLVFIPKLTANNIQRAIKLGWFVLPGMRFLVRMSGRDATDGEDGRRGADMTRSALEYYVDRSIESGILGKEREKLLAGVLDYGDTLARAIMIPRTDVVGLSIDADLDTVLETIETEGFSRYPVYMESVDEVVGIFVVKDMLPYLRGPRKVAFQLGQYIRKPYYVPETKRISELMREMQGRKIHLALIADEFGGTAGLVTQEDIIEEVFGEIYDETDTEETPVVQELGAGRYLVDARISLKDFEEYFEMKMIADGEGEYDTLAGFIVAGAGRVLGQGETYTWEHLQMVVTEADSTHIRTVEIHKGPTGDTDDSSDSESTETRQADLPSS